MGFDFQILLDCDWGLGFNKIHCSLLLILWSVDCVIEAKVDVFCFLF